jgi:hypothetical protein
MEKVTLMMTCTFYQDAGTSTPKEDELEDPEEQKADDETENNEEEEEYEKEDNEQVIILGKGHNYKNHFIESQKDH